jgi:hypothetical protein
MIPRIKISNQNQNFTPTDNPRHPLVCGTSPVSSPVEWKEISKEAKEGAVFLNKIEVTGGKNQPQLRPCIVMQSPFLENTILSTRGSKQTLSVVGLKKFSLYSSKDCLKNSEIFVNTRDKGDKTGIIGSGTVDLKSLYTHSSFDQGRTLYFDEDEIKSSKVFGFKIQNKKEEDLTEEFLNQKIFFHKKKEGEVRPEPLYLVELSKIIGFPEEKVKIIRKNFPHIPKDPMVLIFRVEREYTQYVTEPQHFKTDTDFEESMILSFSFFRECLEKEGVLCIQTTALTHGCQLFFNTRGLFVAYPTMLGRIGGAPGAIRGIQETWKCPNARKSGPADKGKEHIIPLSELAENPSRVAYGDSLFMTCLLSYQNDLSSPENLEEKAKDTFLCMVIFNEVGVKVYDIFILVLGFYLRKYTSYNDPSLLAKNIVNSVEKILRNVFEVKSPLLDKEIFILEVEAFVLTTDKNRQKEITEIIRQKYLEKDVVYEFKAENCNTYLEDGRLDEIGTDYGINPITSLFQIATLLSAHVVENVCSVSHIKRT